MPIVVVVGNKVKAAADSWLRHHSPAKLWSGSLLADT